MKVTADGISPLTLRRTADVQARMLSVSPSGYNCCRGRSVGPTGRSAVYGPPARRCRPGAPPALTSSAGWCCRRSACRLRGSTGPGLRGAARARVGMEARIGRPARCSRCPSRRGSRRTQVLEHADGLVSAADDVEVAVRTLLCPAPRLAGNCATVSLATEARASGSASWPANASTAASGGVGEDGEAANRGGVDAPVAGRGEAQVARGVGMAGSPCVMRGKRIVPCSLKASSLMNSQRHEPVVQNGRRRHVAGLPWPDGRGPSPAAGDQVAIARHLPGGLSCRRGGGPYTSRSSAAAASRDCVSGSLMRSDARHAPCRFQEQPPPPGGYVRVSFGIAGG